MALGTLLLASLALLTVGCSSSRSDAPWVSYGYAFTDAGDSTFIRVQISRDTPTPEMRLVPMFLTPVPFRDLRIAPDTSFMEFVWPDRVYSRCRVDRASGREWLGACRSATGERRLFFGAVPRPEMGDHLPPGPIDLEIIDNARARLADSASWNRVDDRICDRDDGGRVSLFCALYHASIEVTGTYLHRRPAVEFPRYIIRETALDRVVAHSLRDFNNDAVTTHTEILQLLADARQRLVRTMEDSASGGRR